VASRTHPRYDQGVRALIIGVVLISACGAPRPLPEFDEDGEQDGARELDLDGVDTLAGDTRGSLDRADGDARDWKYFEIPADATA
jgi:hypothetical protein